ncbi:hypothetical protein EVAR_51631_1 [Eumeta japonica]|uniref:Uncharacterized protein n=1 Tax=Eumeta variegata TaxID=151549 RepID=A0A4C1YFY6_EUMVA|nr:hypothetical protein EVAR_51631_1 [Eumeta japonica]
MGGRQERGRSGDRELWAPAAPARPARPAPPTTRPTLCPNPNYRNAGAHSPICSLGGRGEFRAPLTSRGGRMRTGARAHAFTFTLPLFAPNNRRPASLARQRHLAVCSQAILTRVIMHPSREPGDVASVTAVAGRRPVRSLASRRRRVGVR